MAAVLIPHVVKELELLEMAMPNYLPMLYFDPAAKLEESWLRTKGNRWPLFVIKKHDATRLHYDFRLEHAGVLKSMVVPDGPCLDPTTERLAVLVGDHQIKYAGSERTIPPGQYGAGPVMLWDYGIWRTDQDVDEALRDGLLRFELWGLKLRGSWSLTRRRSDRWEKQEKWFLRKENDSEAKSLREVNILVSQPNSAATGRTMLQIASDPIPFCLNIRRILKSMKMTFCQPSLFPDGFE
jgi:DNA ligase D-like protein (predicted 3'-phosphoesterase)